MRVIWQHPDLREATIAHLGRVPIFAPLSEEQRGYLVDQMQPRVYAPGERIFEQGASGTELHVVIDGTTSLCARGPGGTETEVSRVGPGGSFGEIGFLAGQPRSLAAVNGPAEGRHLVLSRFDFDRVATLAPDIALGVLERVLALISERAGTLPEAERSYLLWGYGPPGPRAEPRRAWWSALFESWTGRDDVPAA